MERFEKIWTSSENHLENFNVVKKNRNILRNALDPDIDKKFYNFPRTRVSGNIFPVIFENSGHIVVSDDGFQFYKSDNEINSNYQGINQKENTFIPFDQITEIELIKYNSSFISYFDNTWIKILYETSSRVENILISFSGKGFVMKKIKKKNTELLELIKRKLNNVVQQKI